MIYSCFNQQLGLYEYFEDSTTHPTNGDLPVPNLPSKAGKVGVPAQDAGRRMPSGTRRTGTGWRARGIIVQCNNLSTRKLSGLGGTEVNYSAVARLSIGYGTGMALTGYGIYKKRPWFVALGLAEAALFTYWVLTNIGMGDR